MAPAVLGLVLAACGGAVDDDLGSAAIEVEGDPSAPTLDGGSVVSSPSSPESEADPVDTGAAPASAVAGAPRPPASGPDPAVVTSPSSPASSTSSSSSSSPSSPSSSPPPTTSPTSTVSTPPGPTTTGSGPGWEQGGNGTIALTVEEIDGYLIEGFEIGLRFETGQGDVIAALLWSEVVAATSEGGIDAYYDTILDQPVPAGRVVVRATTNVGLGPAPVRPDPLGALRCSLAVEVAPGSTVAVEVGFDRFDCLRRR